MKQFRALLRLQLLSRYADLKPKNWKNLDPKERRRSVGRALLYVFLLLYLGGAMFFLETRAISLLLRMGQPPMGMADLMVIAAVSVSTVGTLILSFFSVMSSLYLGRDAAYTASMPVRAHVVLAAKMTQILLTELAINALILLPACILFGVRTGQDALFYVRMVIVWLFAPMIPVSIGAVLATLLVRASALLRHREAIMTVGGLGLMVAYFYVSMSFGSLTGDTGSGGDMLSKLITSNSARIQGFTSLFPPAGWGTRGMLGDWGQLLLFAAANLGVLALLVFVLGFRYRALSLIQAEAPTASGKKGIQKNAFVRSGSGLTALMMREIRQILRVPAYATNILPVCLMPALMVIMIGVFIGRNMGDNGESIQVLLEHFPMPLTIAAIAGFVGFMADLNPALSTAVTREGKGHDLMLSLPVPVRTHMLSKLLVGYGLTLIGILATGIALAVLFTPITLEALLACVLCILFTYITCCLSLARDVKKPKLSWITEQEAVKQNTGVLVGMLLSLGILVLLGGISYLLIAELSLDGWAYFGVMAALLAAGCLASHRYLMKTGEKYYTAH
ncbi:MAG: hypothetical protein J6U01_09635 [Clostridia bacterium]|nr:hypothetical protein [Clostridia bacterium]